MEEKKETEKMPILEVENLVKSYGKRVVVNGISFTVKQGECMTLFGMNGIGKSTTLDCIVGLKAKDSGTVRNHGFNLDKDPVNFKANLGYVPSEPILYEMMTGEEYLRFVASVNKMMNDAYFKNYRSLVQTFNFPEADIKRRISEYSHGMKQKIGLMASLINNSDLWILDEPTVGLDTYVCTTLINIMKEWKKAGKAILMVSHNIDFIYDVSTKACLLEGGAITQTIDMTKSNPYLKKDMENLFFKLYKGEN